MTLPNIPSTLSGLIRRKHSLLQLWLAVVSVIMVGSNVYAPFALAIDANQKEVFMNGINLFDYNYCGAAAAPAASGTALNGNDNVEKAFNFFVTKGLVPAAAAGIIGNLMVESHLDPAIKQGGGGPGRGIAQWSVGQRWTGVQALAAQEGKPPEDLGVQLDFLWNELNGPYKGSVLDKIKSNPDVQADTDIVLYSYEAAADRAPGGHNSVTRGGIAKQVLAQFGGNAVAVASGTGSTGSTDSSISAPGGGSSSCCPPAGSGAQAAAAPTAGPIWHSGVQPPYSLEAFVVNVIEDIATKLKVNPDSVLTSQHVAAMVAWAYKEGGNITNHDAFNPWNTGLNRPDLIAGGHSGSGVQSFVSFDAGVEANAIVMTSPNQSRLGKVLSDPNSTGAQFMHAVTFFNETPGNKEWAEASKTDPAGYEQSLDKLLNDTCSKYDQMASVVIGPGEMNAHHVPPASLKFHGCDGGTTGATGTGGAVDASQSCPSTQGPQGGNQDIVKTALSLAWPQPTSNTRKDPEPAYVDAVAKYDSGTDYTDCGRFVATVMHMSGVDPNYPPVGTAVQYPYLLAHKEKYQAIKFTSPAQLQPGDILIHPGHTELYVGDIGGGVNTAGASLGDHVPNQNGPGEMGWILGQGDFTAFRVIGGAGGAVTSTTLNASAGPQAAR